MIVIFRLQTKACFINFLGGLILAFGIYNIHSISCVTEGGVLGAMLLLEHWLHISPAISGLILNGACYVLGAKKFGRDFIGYSAISAGSFSLFYAIFEMFPHIYPGIANYPLIAAIVGAIFVGVGAGIAVRAGGAPSGDDALAMSLSRIFKCDIKWIYLASDLLVLGLSLSYIPLKTILYSLLTVVLSGAIISFILKVGKKQDLSDKKDVLVGTLRNAAQLDICLKHNFYHIPTARIDSGNFPIKYVALYQSRSLFGQKSGIRYFGEVENCRLVPRNKITEIPSESKNMYYRFTIKEWKMLPNPILPCEGGFVNLSTSLFLLQNSRDTFELSLRSDDEFKIYRSIIDGFSGKDTTIRTHGIEVCTNNSEVRVSKNGRSVFFCTTEDFTSNPAMMFKYIQNELDMSK